MSLDVIREVWDYHHWANRRLFEVAAALPDDVARRAVGQQFSYPTLLEMFAHLYGADWFWLENWKGQAPAAPPLPEIDRLVDLSARWDALVAEQRRFIGAVTEADLGRLVEGKREGVTFSRPFGMLLVHVPNHATHHRSEVATMLTMVSGSPPDTGIQSYYAQKAAR